MGLDHQFLATVADADGHLPAPVAGLVQHRINLGALTSHHLFAAVDDHLRREHVHVAARLGIVILALREVGAGEGILPAEIVPVVDVEGQGQHARPAAQFAEQPVGRRA
jgi:hypothetical protein